MTSIVDTKHALLLTSTGDTDSARLVMGLLTTVRQIDAACASLLAKHELSEGRLAVLLATRADPGVTPAELAARLGVTRATVTGLTEGLVQAGLLNRATDAADRRSLRLHATPKGDALASKLSPLYARWLDEITDGILSPTRDALTGALATIQHNLAAAQEPARDVAAPETKRSAEAHA